MSVGIFHTNKNFLLSKNFFKGTIKIFQKLLLGFSHNLIRYSWMCTDDSACHQGHVYEHWVLEIAHFM